MLRDKESGQERTVLRVSPVIFTAVASCITSSATSSPPTNSTSRDSSPSSPSNSPPHFLLEIKRSADNMRRRKNYIEFLDGMDVELTKKRIPHSPIKAFKDKEKSSELWMLLDPPEGVEYEEEILEKNRSRRNSEDLRAWKNFPELDYEPEIEKKTLDICVVKNSLCR